MIRKTASIISAIMISIILITIPAYTPVQAGAIADLIGIEDDTGGFVTDNSYDYIMITKLGDAGDAAADVYTTTSKGADLIKYKPELASKLAQTGSRISRLTTYLKGAGQVLNIYNTSVDTYKLFTEKSKHGTSVEKAVDKGLMAIDVGMGWYAIVLGAAAIVTAPAWGTGVVAAAGVTGTTYLVSKLGVGAARIAFNSQTYRDISSFVRGEKKLVFAPFNRPDMKEGLDIIEEELGFDLYPGLKREIPDPSTGIPVYKPNIYLYSPLDMTVNVTLYPEEWITVSDPLYPYGEGWKAVIEDGSLNGCEDYLFYEAVVPDEGLQKNEAFKISSVNRAQDMRSLMEAYGFNSRETEDFLLYWLDKLDEGQDYLFYPQENTSVDLIMPLIVSPAPESLCRIWFYIVPDEGQEIQGPEIATIKREGFTVVEWGGILP